MHLDLNHVYSLIFSGLPINQSFLTGEAAISRAKVLCPRRIAGQSPRPPNTQEEVKERKQLFSNSFQTTSRIPVLICLMWNLKQFEGASLKRLVRVRVRQRGAMAVWSYINTQNFRESANLPWPNSCQPTKMQQVSCVQLGCCRKPTQGLVLEELQKTHRIDMFKPCKKCCKWRVTLDTGESLVSICAMSRSRSESRTWNISWAQHSGHPSPFSRHQQFSTHLSLWPMVLRW